jgi:2-C-methyl-D-erythritol 4-phosphate cytidylyltransferase
MQASVILPAAGLGTRMASGSGEGPLAARKQFMLLEGVPVLVHTIRRFAGCPSVGEVIVALRGGDLEWAESLLAGERFRVPVRVVEGGETRQHSVENALAALAEGAELVAVHDAVRPFIAPETIERVIAEAAQTGAAIVGIAPVDTVKQVQRGKIVATLNRERLVLAQTPQAFRTELLKEAFAKAREDGFIGTDEASLVERLERVQVSVVPGSGRNIKITRPADMDLAQLFLAEERRAAGDS